MMEATTTTQRAPALRIWYGIVGAPVAWVLQELVGWFVVSGSCPNGAPPEGAMSPGAARAALVVVDQVAIAITLGAFWVGWSAWRRGDDRGLTSIHARARPEFLAAAALLVSFTFALAIVLQTIPTFVLPLCESAR